MEQSQRHRLIRSADWEQKGAPISETAEPREELKAARDGHPHPSEVVSFVVGSTGVELPPAPPALEPHPAAIVHSHNHTLVSVAVDAKGENHTMVLPSINTQGKTREPDLASVGPKGQNHTMVLPAVENAGRNHTLVLASAGAKGAHQQKDPPPSQASTVAVPVPAPAAGPVLGVLPPATAVPATPVLVLPPSAIGAVQTSAEQNATNTQSAEAPPASHTLLWACLGTLGVVAVGVFCLPSVYLGYIWKYRQGQATARLGETPEGLDAQVWKTSKARQTYRKSVLAAQQGQESDDSEDEPAFTKPLLEEEVGNTATEPPQAAPAASTGATEAAAMGSVGSYKDRRKPQ